MQPFYSGIKWLAVAAVQLFMLLIKNMSAVNGSLLTCEGMASVILIQNRGD